MDEQALTALVDEVERAWNTHDMGRFAACFADDADFVNVLGQWWRGRTEIEQAHARVHATVFADSTMELELASARSVGSGVLVAHVKWRMVGHIVGGPQRTAQTRTGIFSWVIEERDETPLIVTSHNTDVIEVPPTDPLR